MGDEDCGEVFGEVEGEEEWVSGGGVLSVYIDVLN